ncbi:Metalloprotease MmpA [bacterium HR35]|nr:Metalloprotease MmpA [bacterium HR35]
MEIVLSFLFFLNLIIFFHELGHFLLAKKMKVDVLEFSLGFPPFIFRKKIGETIYSLGLTLLGGYVKLKGEENLEENGFLASPPKVRSFIVLGGILMNVFLAYFLFSLSYLIAFPQPSEKIIVSGFLEGSPAKGFLNKGDVLRSFQIENKKYYFKDPLEVSQFFRNNLGKEIKIEIERQGEIKEITLRLPEKPLNSQAVLGIYLSNFELVKKSFPLNFYFALKELVNQTKKTIFGFYLIFKNFFTKEKAPVEVVGPVGIFNYYRNIQEFGLGYIFYFIGSLSLYLAFFNLLPLPALDGGRLIFILFEMIFKKRLELKIEALIHSLGFLLLFSLLVLITLKDILKLFR